LSEEIAVGFVPLSVGICFAVFAGMLICMTLAHRLGRARRRRHPGAGEQGQNTIESAVFGLLGLLLAFTFSGAAGRFEDRRHLIMEEANAIGTAWLRLDLFPAAEQPFIRDHFRRYVDARLAIYRAVEDSQALRVAAASADAAQRQLWESVVPVLNANDNQRLVNVVVPAFNEMFDLATARMMAMETHQPLLVFGVLVALMLLAAVVSGLSMSANDRLSPLHMLVFAGTLALAAWLILDLEFPRLGLMRIDSHDHLITDLRATMG